MESSLTSISSGTSPTAMCSTPFGIIGIFTDATSRSADSLQRCSTPFGIKGIFTRLVRRRGGRRRLLCSTPFGIIGIFTRIYGTSTGRGLSLCSTPFGIIGIFTRKIARHSGHRSQCSTPFGIIGIFTERSSGHEGEALRCSTPFGIIGIFTWGTARSMPRPRTGAQRLSASLESSLRRWQRVLLLVFTGAFSSIALSRLPFENF